ncbi:MAG TPA: glycosyltransferase family 2 protein [Candidatus Wolfebacteria bacterium]|nr:glycosyltransferase family 2 protein [Candidatus Wolfebacteria bacterium]
MCLKYMYRFFEMVPGILAWSTIILLLFLSWLLPVWAAIFIILFDIYWFLKIIYLSFHLKATFKKMRNNLKINWIDELTKNQKLKAKSWNNIYHLIILPMYKEPYEVVKETFESLLKTNYPKDKFIVVLATEERGGKKTQETAQKIKTEFNDNFFKFLITQHPVNLPDEIPGKGSNQTWAAKEVKKLIIDPLKISYENILASVFDIDTQVLPEYFGILTYNFLTCEHPQHSSFQPIPLFTNNIFQTPALARVIAFSSTFWHMMQQSRPERQTTFSSHSMPFKAVVEVGFWHKDIVSEDSQIFWQCYLHYNGNWRAIPLFYPVSMDANVAPTFWQTMINQYKQQRRWGWGCENIPYFLDGFRKNLQIPKSKKWYWSFIIIESFHSWSTNVLIIFALGWLPIILGGADFNTTLLSYNLPQITRFIMTLSMIGIATSAVLSIILLPPKPSWFKSWHYLLYVIQWILVPFTLIIFGAFPGLEAQTRLMLGDKFHLGFWVTPKHR